MGFEEVIAIYWKRIYSFCYRYLFCHRYLGPIREEAEEITQETFARACEKLGDLRDPTKVKSWLYQIARNLCVDALRRRIETDSTDGKIEMVPDPQPSPEGDCEIRQVREVLRSFPEMYKEPILLVHYRGLSYKEAAEILHVPVNTLRTRLFRAIALLREKMDPKEER